MKIVWEKRPAPASDFLTEKRTEAGAQRIADNINKKFPKWAGLVDGVETLRISKVYEDGGFEARKLPPHHDFKIAMHYTDFQTFSTIVERAYRDQLGAKNRELDWHDTKTGMVATLPGLDFCFEVVADGGRFEMWVTSKAGHKLCVQSDLTCSGLDEYKRVAERAAERWLEANKNKPRPVWKWNQPYQNGAWFGWADIEGTELSAEYWEGNSFWVLSWKDSNQTVATKSTIKKVKADEAIPLIEYVAVQIYQKAKKS